MITKGIKQLIAEAHKRSEGISVDAAKARLGDENTVFVDLRGVLAAATLADMGMQGVLHLEGGFGEWRKAGAPTAPKPEKKKA
jgi:predicted sulfurtransferase